MEEIFYQKTLVGIRVQCMQAGSLPLTNAKESLQLLTLKYKKNTHTIAAHGHAPKKRVTQCLQECLIVRKGKIKIDLYAPDKSYLKSFHLKAGELFILLQGGLAVHFLEDSEVFELKNGPFIKDEFLM